MISDKERREIARKLREINPYRNYPSAIPYHRYIPAVEYLSELAGALGYSPRNDVTRLEFQNRLADLIDPRTCTVDEWRWTDDDDPMPHMCVTSLSCGHEAVTLYGAPRYCPECGAKAITDDDR